MRVVQINSVCGEGSTGRIVSDLHNILIEHGHESYIAYGRNGSGNGACISVNWGCGRFFGLDYSNNPRLSR
jgi:hypothetical protein